MIEYEFTLKYGLHNLSVDPEIYVEQLGEEGCEDALIGIGQRGRIALTFNREGDSAEDAIFRAVQDVKRAIPTAKLIEATPDFVGLTDIADLLGFSRQNMRKLMLKSGAEFPTPVHEGKPEIWHLSKVLVWLKQFKKYPIQETLLEVAEVNMRFNIAKEACEIDAGFQQKVQPLIA